jgi:hypothetical protein
VSTPEDPEILIGEIWTLRNGIGGTGVGAIPAGAEVEITEILPPFSPGVAPEDTIISVYRFADWGYDDEGNFVEIQNSRRLAYPESQFRSMFDPPGSE